MADNENKVNDSGNNLDISKIPNEDSERLASAIESFYRNDSSVKTKLAYSWDRNHRFLDGDQWLVFDGDRDTGGAWRKLTVSKANEYIPRPVTNYVYDTYQTLKSYILKSKPRITVEPNTRSFRDKTAAKIAKMCSEANWERLCEERNYEYAASVLLTYGTVIKKDYWDTTTANSIEVPMLDEAGMEIKDEFGNPVTQQLPLGDVNTCIVEPYCFVMDPLAMDFHKARWMMEYSIQPIELVKEIYGKQEPGYFPENLEEMNPETALSGSVQQFYDLKNSAGVRQRLSTGIGSGSAGYGELTNSVVVKEYYEKPTAQYPRGRMIVVANNKTLFAGDSPYSGSEHGDWHPYSECRWELVPGRFWGKSPLDVICDIQKQINSIDSLLILTRKTSAIPQKLVPTEAGVPVGSWTGRPGQQVPYRAGSGYKPELLPAQGVDASVFQERSLRLEDLKTISGAIDILKGDKPPGVTAASALELLYEVGTGKIYPMLDRWKKFIECSQKKQLKLISKNYKEPRPEYIALLKNKNRDLSDSEIDMFIGADLYDNCNAIVEAGSQIPKLLAARQLRLMEAAQIGSLNLEDPQNKLEFNRQMGIVGFDNEVGPDVKRQEWENDLIENLLFSPDNKPVVLAVDNHQIHLEVVARRMKEPSFLDLPQEIQQAYMQHQQEHQQYIDMEQEQQQMQAALGNAQPQPEGPQGAGGGKGKGLDEDQKGQLRPELDVPGGEQ